MSNLKSTLPFREGDSLETRVLLLLAQGHIIMLSQAKQITSLFKR